VYVGRAQPPFGQKVDRATMMTSSRTIKTPFIWIFNAPRGAPVTAYSGA
jgi:hypothetical protein